MPRAIIKQDTKGSLDRKQLLQLTVGLMDCCSNLEKLYNYIDVCNVNSNSDMGIYQPLVDIREAMDGKTDFTSTYPEYLMIDLLEGIMQHANIDRNTLAEMLPMIEVHIGTSPEVGEMFALHPRINSDTLEVFAKDLLSILSGGQFDKISLISYMFPFGFVYPSHDEYTKLLCSILKNPSTNLTTFKLIVGQAVETQIGSNNIESILDTAKEYDNCSYEDCQEFLKEAYTKLKDQSANEAKPMPPSMCISYNAAQQTQQEYLATNEKSDNASQSTSSSNHPQPYC